MKTVEDFREELKKLEDSLTLNFKQVRNVNPIIDFTKDFGVTVDARNDFSEFSKQMWYLDVWGELPLVDVKNYHTGDNFEAYILRVDRKGILIVDTIDYDTQIVGFDDLNEIRDRLELYEAMLNFIR